jgi:hypothetical protein
MLGAAGALMAYDGGALTPELKAKIDTKVVQLKSWASDPVLVQAVKARNANAPAECRQMTNEKWKGLTLLDPFVRSFSKSAAAERLRALKDDAVTEAFVSAADGTKVAFLAKTTSWSHKDKDKHRVPMGGKVWMGPVEVDQSSGQLQVQVGVPVMAGGAPIGSLVVGLSAAKLK